MIATTNAHEVYRLGLAGSVALSGIETSGNGFSWGLPATAGIFPACFGSGIFAVGWRLGFSPEALVLIDIPRIRLLFAYRKPTGNKKA
ncbi:hypothetical protein ACH50O_05730 [Methylomonas sp. 2BW1-5-20]|uniref:hypothetical protein n=1 Tax=Methylomonas sp. 2BW1-5-20 TaxID=3376686 RepID=UPI004050F909